MSGPQIRLSQAPWIFLANLDVGDGAHTHVPCCSMGGGALRRGEVGRGLADLFWF